MDKRDVKRCGILTNKIYLYLTEFFAGMSVMAVELGASRLLAPYFSSSQIVWTIIIGTIMIAMALGNLYGGRMADKDPNPDKLYQRLLIAAVWIAAIPVLGKYVIILISGLLVFSVSSHFLVIAAFAACMVIFVFPLFLLGTVTPSLVKYTVDSLSDNGKTVGALSASNTIGSIIGTFVPTFISIPAVGTSVTFLIFAGILLLLAVIYFISSKSGARRVAVGVFLFLLCCILGHSNRFAFWQNDLTYEGESVYNYLQVYEQDNEVMLSTNVLFGVQSVYNKDKNLTGMYYDYAMAAPYMAGVREKETMKVLCLGMGTGTYATQCMRYFDNLELEGVEIDRKITDLAEKYFALPEDVRVTTCDGRAYLNTAKEKYDVILVDAYQDITIPFQMSSMEFFDLVRRHLTPDGVMVVNMNMRGTQEGNMNQYLSDTIAGVFDEVYTIDVEGYTNRVLYASNASGMSETYRRNISKEQDVELRALMKRIDKNMSKYQAGSYCMTDDKAPVELLGMRVIDELIRDEVSHYKKIYREQGLKELINQL